MVMRKKRFSFYSVLLFIPLFFLLLSRRVFALVYADQVYYGWGFFGFGFDNLVSLYYTYPGWIDFIIFFAIFLSAGNFALGKKFEGKAGKALSLALAVALSLSLVLFEANSGILLLEQAWPILLFFFFILFFVGMFTLAKKMGAGGFIAFGIAAILSTVLFYVLSGITGLPASSFGSAAVDNVGAFVAGFDWFALLLVLIFLIGFITWFANMLKVSKNTSAGHALRPWRWKWWKKPFKGTWNVMRGKPWGGGEYEPEGRPRGGPTETRDFAAEYTGLLDRCTQIVSHLRTLADHLERFLSVGGLRSTTVGTELEALLARVRQKITNMEAYLRQNRNAPDFTTMIRGLQQEIGQDLANIIGDIYLIVTSRLRMDPPTLRALRRLFNDLSNTLNELSSIYTNNGP